MMKVNTLPYRGITHARKRPPQHKRTSDLTLKFPFLYSPPNCLHLCPLSNM